MLDELWLSTFKSTIDSHKFKEYCEFYSINTEEEQMELAEDLLQRGYEIPHLF